MSEHSAACPACGGREWSTASDGLGDAVSVAAACVSCHYVTSSTVDLSTIEGEQR